MGFLSKLFGKKSDKLSQEQLDDIDEKVEESEEKHVKDRAIFSDLKKPSKTKVIKTAKPDRKKAKPSKKKTKSSPKAAKKQKKTKPARKKSKKSSGKKRKR